MLSRSPKWFAQETQIFNLPSHRSAIGLCSECRKRAKVTGQRGLQACDTAGYKPAAPRLCVLAFLLGFFCLASHAADLPEIPSPTRNQAQAWYEAARSNYFEGGLNTTSAWKFAEACFELAEHSTNDTQRASLAEEGIAAAEYAVQKNPRSAPGHFYLAMNKGQLARTRTLGALPLVKEMEESFLTSIRLDPRFNFASAHRSLGMLYLDAPGWPASIGSKSKARRHLEKAVELAPDYPTNHLELMRACLRWGDKSDLAKTISRYTRLLPSARQKLTGETWKNSWKNWDAEWSDLQSKLEGD